MTRRLQPDMRLPVMRWAAALALAAAWSHCLIAADSAEESRLLAHYSFDEAEGTILHDSSDNGNHGVIHNAQWVKTPRGGALKFGRTESYVDFGVDSPLKPSGDFTILAWVKLEAEPYLDDKTNWTIVDWESYKKSGAILRIDGHTAMLRFRSSQEDATQQRSSSIALANNTWYQVAVTKQAAIATCYINGVANLRFSVKDPGPGDIPFMISSRSQSFGGLIEDLAIYNRALSPEEVRAAHDRGATGQAGAQERVIRSRLKAGPALKGKGFTLRVGPHGGMEIDINGDAYFVESFFSYPGDAIGYNCFCEGEESGDPLWKPRVRAKDSDEIAVSAKGGLYSIDRTVKSLGRRVLVSDTLTNTSNADVGIIVRNVLIAAKAPKETLLCGVPGTAAAKVTENPTILLSQDKSSLGAVADDDVSRIQFEAAASANCADFQLRHLALAPGKSVTLEWYLYPLGENDDYWALINRIRDDWKVNFRIDGPADFIHLTRNRYWRIYHDETALRAFLQRTNLKIIQVGWLDFNHHNTQTGELISRDEFKRMMHGLKKVVKSVDPSVWLVGDVEAPYVSLPRALCEKLYAAAPEGRPATFYGEFSPAQMKILEESPEGWSRWKDSVVWSEGGNAKHIFYSRNHRDGTFMPMIALTVYPVLGNGQHEYLMEQARFILQDAGLDGVYFDSFTSGMHSYDRWDGLSADIDSATGRITRKYSDLTLAGAASRAALIEYVLSAAKVCVINGHAISRQTRSLPAIRFDEMFSYVDPLAFADGQKPPLVGKLCYAHLSSPVGLGFKPDSLGQAGRENYAQVIMKAAISYLRHGVLYYHYETFIPETGPGSGEYGPFNHMFPITPVRLGEGFVEGKERIVTCVSGEFDWPKEAAPKVLLFDITGRPKSHSIEPVRTEAGWRVRVALADWQEIAVVEQ